MACQTNDSRRCVSCVCVPAIQGADDALAKDVIQVELVGTELDDRRSLHALERDLVLAALA